MAFRGFCAQARGEARWSHGFYLFLKTRPCKFFGLHGLFIFAACTFSVITQMGFYKKFYSIFI
jgi:hypothetical protein